MHEEWERYKDLFRRCPMHGLPEWTQVSIFYNSVNTPTRMMLDASSNGTLLDKPLREGLEILEKLAQNYYQHPTTRRGTISMVKNLHKQPAIHEVKVLDSFCEICGNNHDSSHCGQNPESSCYVGNYNMNAMANTYNPAGKKHPNFSWQNQNNTLNPSTSTQQDTKISQVLKSRPIGGFPSDTEVTKGATHEQCKAISTRSGKVLKTPTENKQGEATATNSNVASDTDSPTLVDTPASVREDLESIFEPEEAETTAAPQTRQPRKDTLDEPRPPPPFPQSLKKQKQEYQYKKFFDILKQVHTNLPLVEALQQMPNYAKFLKDMVSRKTRIGEFETATAIEACLAMMHNKVPANKADHGSFTISCSIGNNYSTKALCDPGASINLMPKSVFQKLGIGEAKPTGGAV
ncbi:hypothetical protein V6N13_023076 [Hibiscus sabdariffa]